VASHALSRRGGFTLIITISLVMLLVIIAVGLLSLSSVALRTTTTGKHEAEARANARMALMLAIGDLQKELGPDQRVSARAAILDEDTSSVAPDGISHPHWLGAWNSWTDWLNNPEIRYTYDKGRSSKFRRWLVSHPNPVARDDMELVSGNSLPESVEMVKGFPAGASGVATEPVRAPIVKTNGNGHYAWWITGENQKAHVALTPPEAVNNTARLHDRSQWPNGKTSSLAGLAKAPTDPLLINRSITLPTLGLGVDDLNFRTELRSRFHDLTVDSTGVAVNVRHGGLKKDLNLLLEMERPPNEYGTYSLANPNGNHASIRPFSGHIPAPFYAQNNNFPSWYKLHQYYQLYRGGGDEVAADSFPLPFNGKGVWGTATQPNINFNWHRQNLDYFGIGRTPIVTRLMLVFSTRRMASTTTPGTFDYKLGVNPVVVLWNPYNVTLHSPRLWIQITPGALKYKAYVDGVMKVNWTQLRRSNGNFQLNIYPMEGPAQTTVPIILKPGETRIYSAVTGFANSNDFLHAELYPGYQAPDAGGGFEVGLNGMTSLPGTARVEMAMRLDDQRTDHGGQYQMYWTVRNAQTGENQRYNEMAANPVQDGNPIYLAEDTAGKRILFSNSAQRVPFANFQFVQKSGQDLRNPGAGYAEHDSRCRNFIHANPANQRAMYGEATPRMRGLSQYHVQIETGSGNSLNPDFDPANNRAYIGSAISPGNSRWPGQPNMVTNEFPLVPVTSLASLMHFKLNPADTRVFNTGRHLWDISANQALGIGNSFAHPLIPGDAIYQDVPDAACRGTALQMQLLRDFHDHAYLNNDALWDDWFCSGITREDQGLFQTGRNMEKVVREFWTGVAPTQNPHLIPWRVSSGTTTLQSRLLSGALPKAEAHRIAARYLTIEGAFNINSTSVDAWKAFLAGSQDKTIISIDPQSGNVRSDAAPQDRVILSRFSLPASPKEGQNAGDPAAWLGVRHLTPQQIDRLARECIRQVKERGPFLNLSDFINRRLANDETGIRGALQAAIDWDETLGRKPESASAESINGRFKSGDDFIATAKIAGWGLPFPQAATGSRFAGIPGYLTQADLLKRVGNMITPRDDTFRIRGYGQSIDANGTIRARIWCDAVVRRSPDYLDAKDLPEITTVNLSSAINRSFGRRFEIISFRWLLPSEI
jgi:hypothetical protein